MKVVEEFIRQIKITEVDGLDPVRVMIEEYSHGQAKVVIECYGQSWSSYWGSMGGDLKEFFTRTNVGYLVNCFDRGISSTTGELDTHTMKESFVEEVRKYVIERVKDGYTQSPANRDVYDECIQVDLQSIAPKHPYDMWSFEHYSMTEGSWEEVFSDTDFFSEWMENHVPDIYETNHEYGYLCRIVSAVKEAITGVPSDAKQ